MSVRKLRTFYVLSKNNNNIANFRLQYLRIAFNCQGSVAAVKSLPVQHQSTAILSVFLLLSFIFEMELCSKGLLLDALSHYFVGHQSFNTSSSSPIPIDSQ